MHHSPFNHTPDSLFCPLPRSYLSSPLPRLFPLSSAKIFVPAFLLQQKNLRHSKKAACPQTDIPLFFISIQIIQLQELLLLQVPRQQAFQ